MYVKHLPQCLLFSKQPSNGSNYYNYFVFEGSGFKETQIIILNISFDGKEQLIQRACFVDWAKSNSILSLFILDCLFYYFKTKFLVTVSECVRVCAMCVVLIRRCGRKKILGN